MSLPIAAKRRHFDHKREQDEDDDEEEEDNEVNANMTRRRDHDQSDGVELNNVSVNAKIGHFERLLQHHDSKLATGGYKCHHRHQLAEVDMLHEGQVLDACAQSAAHDEPLDEDIVGDVDDEYLGLDTIVEEDEEDDEASTRHAATIKTQVKLRNNCDNNIPSGNQTARLPTIHVDTSHANNDDNGGGSDSVTGCANRDIGNQVDTPSRPPAEMTSVIGSSTEVVPSSKAHQLCRQSQVAEPEQASPRTTISENNDELVSSNNINNNSFDTTNSASMERQPQASDASPESSDYLTATTTANSTSNITTRPTSQEQTSDNKRMAEPSTNNAGELKVKPHQQQQAYPPILLPSTNRLISEHQARQQQTLFRALAERQKLLDELGPDERQQQADLMSSCLNPSIWRRHPNKQNSNKPASKRTQRKTSKRRREAAVDVDSENAGPGPQHHNVQLSNYVTLKLSSSDVKKSGKSAASSSSSSSSSKGVPLSAVDLSSVSDRMLDELLGHIASASSSSSKAGSLDSSDLSSLSGNEDDGLHDGSSESEPTSSSCSSSATDEDGDDGAARRYERRKRPGPTGRHARKYSYDDVAGVEHDTPADDRQSLKAARRDHVGAPSVIGVHDETDSGLVGAPPSSSRQLKPSSGRSAVSRKCREAYKKKRHGPNRSDEDDDYQDEDRNRRNQGDLAVSSAGTGSGSFTSHRSGGKPSGCSLSPASTRRQQNSSSTVLSDNNSTGTGQWLMQRAGDLDACAAGANASESPTTSDEPSSMSLPMGPSDLEHERPHQRDQHQSVEAILGRMLEALQEVGVLQQQRQGEEQEQLNDLLERGFLHLEQLLNCSLAPRSSAALNQGHLSSSGSPGSQLGQQAPPNSTISSSQKTTSAMPLGGSHIMLSKDSDYGSDTQSADCFSHSTSSGASNSSPAASAPHPSRPQASTKLSSSWSAAPPSQHAARRQFDHTDQVHQQQQHLASADQELLEGTAFEAPSTSEGALSPLAIELSFKLAESLRNLAQQQQQQAAIARAHSEHLSRAPAASGLGSNNDQGDGDDEGDQNCVQSESMTTRRQSLTSDTDDYNSRLSEQQASVADGAVTTQVPTLAPTASARARMKSVVMINSPASSSLASRPHSSQSQASLSSSSPSATVASGNMTPVDCGRSSSLSQQPSVSSRSSRANQIDNAPPSGTQSSLSQRQQFKTLVNLNSGPDPLVNKKSSAVVASSPDSATQTIVKVVVPNRSAGALERRPRSSFRSSSLRRKSSFSGSVGGGASREPGAPRPGSPVPRSTLQQNSRVSDPHQALASPIKTSTQQPAVAASMETARAPNQAVGCGEDQDSSGQANTTVRQQRQLQRALILAQKYNYSPAKLATSKLGLELQLAASTTTTKDPNRQVQEATDVPNGSSPALFHHNKGGQFPVNSITGQVQLEISYFAKSGSLTVHLLQCTKLAPMAKRHTTSNPYVKLYLLPDRSKAGKRKSSIKRHQLDPKFNERFTFGPLQLADFDGRCLWLSVWHKDRGLGRNESLGELLLPMSQVRAQLLTSDLCQSTPATWYQLQDRSKRHHSIQQQERAPIGMGATSSTKVMAPNGGATENNADTDQALGRVQSSPQLTTKVMPKSNGHLSLMLARPKDSPRHQSDRSSAPPRVQQQQAAELVARKLSEFERKAARLTQQAQQRLSPSLGAQNLSRSAAQLPNSRSVGKGATLAPGLANGRLQPQQQQHWQSTPPADFKTMQVTLGASLQLNVEQAASGGKGQLFVALKFVPESGDLLARRTANMEGSLHVLIKEARNIAQSSSSATGESGNQGQQQLPSPYCKCYLLDAYGQRVAKQKTGALKRTSSPRWDHECVFANLRLTQLTAQAIEVLLLNRDSILVSTGDKCLGAIRLCKRLRDAAQAGDTGTDNSDHSLTNGAGLPSGSNSASWSSLHQSLTASMKSNKSTGSDASASSNGDDICSEREARLWGQMLARPNIWVYGELPLRQLRPLIPNIKCQQTASNSVSSSIGIGAAIGSHTIGHDQ